MKKREANFELLRIAAMCMIIGLHYLDKGGVLGVFTEKSGIRGLLPWLFEAFFFPAVNVYVLITGYFLAEKEVKLGKLAPLWQQVLFYSLLLGILAYALGIADLSELNIYRGKYYLFPVITEHYWFITSYILLYILLPFCNPALQKMNRKQMRNGLLFLLCLLSVSKSVLPLSLAIDKNGYDVLWFLCLYITGAYYRRFGFPYLTGRAKGILLYVLSSAAMFASAIILRAVYVKTGHLKDIITYAYSYNHIFCYLAAVGLFVCFSEVRISSERAERVILGLAGTALGVYLLHEHMDFRYVWQQWFCVGEQAESVLFPFFMCGTIATVFLVCAAAERLRQFLFAKAKLLIKRK